MKESIAGIAAEITRFVFGMSLVGMNAVVLYYVLVHGVADTSKELTIMIVNGSGTITGLVISYYFGSSAGSAAKDRTIADASKKGSN